MHLFPDFRDLLAAFVESGVEFVLIGGYAVIFHSRPRLTKDIDLLVAIDEANRERIAIALEKFGAAREVVQAARRMKATEVVYFGINPLRVDILGSASGIDFHEVHERSVTAIFDGVPVPVIGLDDLIVNKRASGRPQDLRDVTELERVRDKQA